MLQKHGRNWKRREIRKTDTATCWRPTSYHIVLYTLHFLQFFSHVQWKEISLKICCFRCLNQVVEYDHSLVILYFSLLLSSIHHNAQFLFQIVHLLRISSNCYKDVVWFKRLCLQKSWYFKIHCCLNIPRHIIFLQLYTQHLHIWISTNCNKDLKRSWCF